MRKIVKKKCQVKKADKIINITDSRKTMFLLATLHTFIIFFSYIFGLHVI